MVNHLFGHPLTWLYGSEPEVNRNGESYPLRGAAAKNDGNGLVSMADGVCEMYRIGNACCSEVGSRHKG